MDQSIWSDVHGREQWGTDTICRLSLTTRTSFLFQFLGPLRSISQWSLLVRLHLKLVRKNMGRLVLKRKTFKFPPTSGNKIVGFHGSACYRLDFLGAYSEPTSSSQLVTVGAFGGTGGTSWNDEVHILIRQLIMYSSDVVKSIQVEYDDKGKSKWSAVHGWQSGTMRTVELDYPNEFLVSISGYYCKNGSDVDIYLLKFESTRKTYGPFGTERGQAFKVPASSGNKIIGFFGKLSCHVHSIGAYYEPFFVSGLSKLSSIHGRKNGTIHAVSLILISNIFLSHATLMILEPCIVKQLTIKTTWAFSLSLEGPYFLV